MCMNITNSKPSYIKNKQTNTFIIFAFMLLFQHELSYIKV